MFPIIERRPKCATNSFKSQVEKYAITGACATCGYFKVKYFDCCSDDKIEKVIYYQKDDRKTIRDQCMNVANCLTFLLPHSQK
jgi:hypothetical protein